MDNQTFGEFQLSSGMGSGAGKFSDPFMLPSSGSMPLTMSSAFDYCLFLYFLENNIRQATKRIASHFTNPLDIVGDVGDDRERREYKEYLEEDLDLQLAMLEMGEEWGCYGNSFWRIHAPFDRYLADWRNGQLRSWALSMFPRDLVTYNWDSVTYTVPDPMEMARGNSAASAKKVTLPIYDLKSTDKSRIRLRKIDPRRVILWHSMLSGKQQVIYRFEEQFISLIRSNKLYQINETPLVMLKAIADNQDFIFDEGEVFHFKAPTISGISANGWGLPETLANYRALHQLMVYRKIDEAIGLDYIMPWRIVAPNLGDKLGDMADTTNLGQWKAAIRDMIARCRKDPYAVQSMPFPVHYQELNGNGKALVPKDLIEHQLNVTLDGFGYPSELFRGSLVIVNTPTALRLFQNTFRFMYSGFNKFSRWVSTNVCDYVQQDQMKTRLQLPTIADDLEAKHLYLQLAAGGDLSRATAYAPLNITDPVGEAEKRMKEDADIQQRQMKIELDMQRKMELGSMDDVASAEQEAQLQGSLPGGSGGGAAGAPPSGVGMTPMEVQQKAVDMANQWASIPDNGQRAKAMRQVEATDYQTYAIAKQLWEQMKADGASQGRKAVTSGQGGM